jgi:putative transposase
VKYAFMAQHRSVWPVRGMSRVLGVSPSGFYEWAARPPSARAQANQIALARIRESFEASDRTYGSPRVWRDLRDWNVPCSENRVARLMSQAKLIARPKRRQPPFDTGERSIVAPNVLDRQFDATAPNQKWVADFTYVWTGEGWLYIAVVLDLYSRLVVGWSMQAKMTAQLVIDALLMAIWRRRPKDTELLHHSDQGSQYTSEQFQEFLAEHGIQCSMSRSGNCWDNAAMESFFSTLKAERMSRRHYSTRDEAKADAFDYMERFYNPRRRHSTLGYVSPANFEKLQRA